MFHCSINAYSRIGIAALVQLRAPGSIPGSASNFYTISSMIGITTTIADNISCGRKSTISRVNSRQILEKISRQFFSCFEHEKFPMECTL